MDYGPEELLFGQLRLVLQHFEKSNFKYIASTRMTKEDQP